MSQVLLCKQFSYNKRCVNANHRSFVGLGCLETSNPFDVKSTLCCGMTYIDLDASCADFKSRPLPLHWVLWAFLAASMCLSDKFAIKLVRQIQGYSISWPQPSWFANIITFVFFFGSACRRADCARAKAIKHGNQPYALQEPAQIFK